MNEYKYVHRVRSVPANDFLREEVARAQRLHMGLDEVLPRDGWLSIVRNGRRTQVFFDHDIPYRRVPDKDSELLEFATDAAVAPRTIFKRKTADKCANGLCNAPPPGAVELDPIFRLAHPGFICIVNDDIEQVSNLVAAQFTQPQ